MLHVEFPRFADEHADFVQSALIDAMRTGKADGGFCALVELRARGHAKRRANSSTRETTARAEPTEEARPFISGKRPLARTRLSRADLDRLGRFYQNESGRLTSFLAGGLLFKADFISAHFATLGRLIQSSLGAAPPENFVLELMDFANRTARLSPTGDMSWVESDDTERLQISGQTQSGKKPGRRRAQPAELPLRGETEFHQKRKDVGRLLAAHALQLCGFTSREVHDLARRKARKWSATRALWIRKLEEAHDAEPAATDERFLELTVLSAPGAVAGPLPDGQAPARHPAFRRRGRRAK
jgi:hypothetical protein